jgi:hypothetical protein
MKAYYALLVLLNFIRKKKISPANFSLLKCIILNIWGMF